MANEKNHDSLGRSWKTWGFILAGLAVVVIAGLILPQVFPKQAAAPTETTLQTPTASSQAPGTPETPGSTDAPTTPSSEPPSSTQSSSTQTSAKCPSMSANNSFPVEAPKTSWETHPSGTFLPVSTEYGPAVREGNFWRCFPRTSTGSLFAGITLWSEFVTGYAQQAAIDTPQAREEFNKLPASPRSFPRVTGYQIISSSGSSATISYLYKAQDRDASLQLTVMWDEQLSDWRFDVTSYKVTVDVDPSSFTVWK